MSDKPAKRPREDVHEHTVAPMLVLIKPMSGQPVMLFECDASFYGSVAPLVHMCQRKYEVGVAFAWESLKRLRDANVVRQVSAAKVDSISEIVRRHQEKPYAAVVSFTDQPMNNYDSKGHAYVDIESGRLYYSPKPLSCVSGNGADVDNLQFVMSIASDAENTHASERYVDVSHSTITFVRLT